MHATPSARADSPVLLDPWKKTRVVYVCVLFIRFFLSKETRGLHETDAAANESRGERGRADRAIARVSYRRPAEFFSPALPLLVLLHSPAVLLFFVRGLGVARFAFAAHLPLALPIAPSRKAQPPAGRRRPPPVAARMHPEMATGRGTFYFLRCVYKQVVPPDFDVIPNRVRRGAVLLIPIPPRVAGSNPACCCSAV